MKNILVMVNKKYPNGRKNLYLTKVFDNEKVARNFVLNYKRMGYVVEVL